MKPGSPAAWSAPSSAAAPSTSTSRGKEGITAMSSADTFLSVAFVIGYLLGSIPFGLILTRVAGTQDLRSIGSGNIGATNVLRTGRKGLAAGTLILDMLKGTA